MQDVEQKYQHLKQVSSNEPESAVMYLRGSFLIKSGIKEETGRPYRFLEFGKDFSMFLDPMAWPDSLIDDGHYQGFFTIGLARAQKGWRPVVRSIHTVKFELGKAVEILEHDGISVGEDLP